jgi:hypothetical protein
MISRKSDKFRMRHVQFPLAGCLAVLLSCSAHAGSSEIFWVDPGKNVDVYWDVNLSGKVYLAADVNGIPACLDYWWIVWPFTQIKQLGRHCGRAVFELPTLGDWAIGGKLRAGGATVRTRIQGTADEALAHNFPEIHF